MDARVLDVVEVELGEAVLPFDQEGEDLHRVDRLHLVVERESSGGDANDSARDSTGEAEKG